MSPLLWKPAAHSQTTLEDLSYRVRIGDYRIVYEIFDARLVIQVVRVGQSRDVHQAR